MFKTIFRSKENIVPRTVAGRVRFEKEIKEIEVELLLPNRFSPRNDVDANITSLMECMRNWGFLEPVIVRRLANKYEIIKGARRVQTAIKLGMKTVPSIIVECDEKDIGKLLSIVNHYRESYCELDEGWLFMRLTMYEELEPSELADILHIPLGRIERGIAMAEEDQYGIINHK